MSTRRWTALIASTVIVASLGAPAGASPVPGRCTLPEPVLEYDASEISVSLEVDYSACRWWRGRDIVLTGFLDRRAVGDLTTQGTGAGSGCTLVTARGNGRSGRLTSCDITLGMDHDAVEVASYSGEFEFPWRGGQETVAFSYSCSSTPLGASCD